MRKTDLHIRDKELSKISELILAKRKMLINKAGQLKLNVSNPFLKNVVAEYEKYHQISVNENDKITKAMLKLIKYIAEKNSDENAKKDLGELHAEIAHIKNFMKV